MKTFDNVILVLDKGFVYWGDLYIANDGWFVLENAHNIRRFGTQRGLGQLALTGPTKETILDPCPPIRGCERAIIHIIECEAKLTK